MNQLSSCENWSKRSLRPLQAIDKEIRIGHQLRKKERTKIIQMDANGSFCIALLLHDRFAPPCRFVDRQIPIPICTARQLRIDTGFNPRRNGSAPPPARSRGASPTPIPGGTRTTHRRIRPPTPRRSPARPTGPGSRRR